MTDTKTPPAGAAPPPAAPAPPAQTGDGEPGTSPWIMFGNAVVLGGLVVLGIIALDLALKGRLLGPLFARLGAPGPAPQQDAAAGPVVVAPPSADGAAPGEA